MKASGETMHSRKMKRKSTDAHQCSDLEKRGRKDVHEVQI